MTPTVVVLTMGDRPDDLARALASIHAQDGVEPEVIVVGNGCSPDVPDSVRLLTTEENVGVAAGRNLGWEAATGDVVFFLDDDARYDGPGVLVAALERFAIDERVWVMSFRIADEGGRVISKHIPMLWKRRPERIARATTFLGGACGIRRSVRDRVGAFPGEFFYALEETDLAWRVLDAGGAIVYAGDLTVIHPSLPLSSRAGAIFKTARNRVLLARRRLPVPLAVVHLAIRGLLSLGTVRSIADLRALAGGYRAGLVDETERAPMRWRTAWRMTLLGRPPIV